MKNETNDFGVDLSKTDLFSSKRMFTVTFRVLRQITRDRRTFGMILVMPIVIMIVFGVALTGEINNVPIVVINNDVAATIPSTSIQITAGEKILEGLQADDRVHVENPVNNWDKATNMVESGEINAVILIPENFSSSIVAKRADPTVSITISIYIDATKPAIRASILGALQEALQSSLGNQAVEIDQELAFGGKEFSGFDVAIPAVMALVLTFLVLLISLVTIVRDQLYGTQARMYSTPLTKFERLMGFVLALSIVGVMMVITVILIGTVVFGATVQGNLFVLLLFAYLYSIVHVLLAMFLSNFAQNELQAVQFAPLIAFPGMALSGMLTPLNALPEAAQIASNFIPMTYGVRIFEGLMLKGFTIADLWTDVLALCGFAVIFFTLSLVTIKDKID